MYSYTYSVITKKFQGYLFPRKRQNRLVWVTLDKKDYIYADRAAQQFCNEEMHVGS